MAGLQKRIARMKCDIGIYKLHDCTPQENAEYANLLSNNKPLPPNVIHRVDNCFQRFDDKGYTEEEVSEYLNLKKILDNNENNANIAKIAEDIHTIKKCVIFFTVLTVIGLVGGFIISLIH